ncbi:uncharacterized protein LOC143291090 [Babylonia areolata]|uniref:uncharacterized protein LOC143291090 n=1 Tax=Babylonia areolata TaxID=304850 RepID=UPI003FD6852E
MNGIEQEPVEKKDHSRPFFSRKAGEMGLYVDVDVAVCVDAHAYGSEHLMRVEMNDKLSEQLSARDLVKVKAELERRGVFRGVVLEEVRRGGILAVIFDSLEALQDLWKLHEGKQLSPLFQSMLVDKALIDSLGVRELTVRVRMWPDELEACREEMAKMAEEQKRVNIHTRPRDVAILQQVQQFQKDSSTKLREQLQDAVSEFDLSLSEFLLEIKQALPQSTTKLSTLKEFQNNMKVAMGAPANSSSRGMNHVRHYFSTLELMRTWLAQAEVHLCLPLLMVPERCETEKQRQLKAQMRSTCSEMQKLLKPTVSLKDVHFKEWEGKVLARERSLFMGLISLMPLGLDRVTDVDQALDEYINNFPAIS